MAESTEITQVADAFDDDGPLDVNLSLGYEFSTRTASILRESATTSGLYTRGYDKIGDYKETTNRLLTRAEIGIYHDFALVVRMPVILSNSQSIGNYQGPGTQMEGLRAAPGVVNPNGTVGDQLFTLPFSAPTRQGIEYLALGLDLGLMNQYRDHTKPTWIIGFETRLSVSEPMHACNNNPKAGEVQCAAPGDVDRNGQQNDSLLKLAAPSNYPIEGTATPRQAGVSRGTTGFELHSYISKRVKYIEPYGGVRVLVEVPNSSSDYGVTDLRGNLVNHPPVQGTLIAGLSVIPWESRSEFQRLTLDFRLEATYRSEGRDYNELFDALGSSDSTSIRMPNYTGYLPPPTGAGVTTTATSSLDPNSQRVFFSGLLDTQQYIITRYSFGLTYQLNKNFKFTFGTALNHIQSHFLTVDLPCNASLSATLQQAGPCRTQTDTTSPWAPTGVPNPNYRAVIDVPGRRFVVDSSSGFDGWLSATAMF